MIRHLTLATLLLSASPAFAQQAQPPSKDALIKTLHQQVYNLTDEVTVADSTLIDEQQQIATLQAQLAAAQKAASTQNSSPAKGQSHVNP